MKRNRKRFQFAPYLYLAPALIIFGIFTYWPMLYGFYLSFHNWNFVRPTKGFVGLSNYIKMLGREDFRIALVNTGKYFLGLIPLLIFIPILLAFIVGLCSKSRMKSAYRTLLFFPSVLSFSVASIIWIWLLNPVGGLVNKILAQFGFDGPAWIADPRWALLTIVVIAGWKMLGNNFILFMSAFEGVPTSYVEAAVLDGATFWQRFWYIELPMVSPTTFFVFTTTLIFSTTNVFTPIHVLTRGGPFNSTTNLSYMIYDAAFQYFNVGLASSVAVVTFIIFLVANLIQSRFSERGVHYGS